MSGTTPKNRLFYSDNLDVLKHSIEDESIDLIYIDPPFNSKRNYNVLFETIDMSDTTAQRQAFADTWTNVSYIDELYDIMDLSLDLHRFLKMLDQLQISKGVVSYLTTMALRIFYMHKKLKQTGSFYLHCDPTMSHYLKIVCDLIFGKKNFRNEIVWCYETGGRAKTHFPRKHDILLRYSKSDVNPFYYDAIALERDVSTMHEPVLRDENDRPYQRNIKNGKEYRYYLTKGVLPNDWWTDIQALNPAAKERLGYPTQKPEPLLERLLKASSKEGDVVADFFCGCGTAVAVAERLNRQWIGVDISHLAVRLILDRLLDPYEDNPQERNKIRKSIDINGFPKDIATARELAQSTKRGRFKFQDWIVEVMLGGVANPKKVGDGGYDGYITFLKGDREKGVILIEVKSGNVNVTTVREFIHVVNTVKAHLGIFVCFEEQVTKPMLLEAKNAGHFEPDLFGKRYDRIQILTVEQLLEGMYIDFPAYQNSTFKKASKTQTSGTPSIDLFEK